MNLENLILELIKLHSSNSQCSLTNRDIMDKVNAKSIASVDRALARLKVKGLIETKKQRIILTKTK